MAQEPPELREKRRRLFRQMEWTFVWGPALLTALVAVIGGALLAWVFPLPGTTFRERWLYIVLIVVGLPLGWVLLRSWLDRNRN